MKITENEGYRFTEISVGGISDEGGTGVGIGFDNHIVINLVTQRHTEETQGGADL